MKKLLLTVLIAITTCLQINAQVAFEDDFESYTINDELTSHGYEITQNSSYTGTVSATVGIETTNKHAVLFASPNGAAQMQFRRTITVSEKTIYTFEVYTQGPFKRKLRFLDASNNAILAESTDVDPSGAEETQWIKQSLSYFIPEGVTSIKIAIYHNWSGTLLIDDLLVEPKTASNYYLSSSTGDDSNDGSIDSPWSSLSKISEANLVPGDTIFFKKDERFDGHFIVNGSGTLENPIVITQYGTGEKPIITGEVGAAGGGDYEEAIYIENNDNIVFDGLEINNERLNTRTGVDDRDAFGIHITNTGTEIMENFIFRNMVFQNVYAVEEMNDPDDFNGLEVAGVRFYTAKNTVVGQEKNILNVLMENCYFTDIQRLGVHIKHGGGSSGVGNEMINKNMDFVFRNNEFHYTGGTCILPTNTYNCLIEDNLFNYPGADTDPRMPNRGSAVWTWRCINTVIQNNTCLHIRGYLDSHGIHIDHENENTFVQYNYMEDCEGGFVEILGGNVNSVYRFNISVNDGWRSNPNWANSNHTLWINEVASGNTEHQSEYNYIYNNTVYINNPYSTAIDMDSKYTFIYNNIFYSINGSDMGGQQVSVKNNGTPLFMTNNLFYGTIATAFKNMDSNPTLGNPAFNEEDNGTANGYQLNANSIAIDTGIAHQGPPLSGAGTGIFIDIPEYPNVDYFGNPIDLSTGTPNIGACNAKNGEIVMNINDAETTNSIYKIAPNPVKDKLKISGLTEKTEIKIYNLLGQLVHKGFTDYSIDVSSFKTGIYYAKINKKDSIRFIKAD